jgi:hypothetical protein
LTAPGCWCGGRFSGLDLAQLLPMIRPLEMIGQNPEMGRSRTLEVHMSDLPSRVGYTVTFLRMTATGMRELAEATPEIARELRDIAEQVQIEADSLAGHISE